MQHETIVQNAMYMHKFGNKSMKKKLTEKDKYPIFI